MEARAQKAVNEAAERIKSGKVSGLEIVTEVKDGHAKDVILDEAEKWEGRFDRARIERLQRIGAIAARFGFTRRC